MSTESMSRAEVDAEWGRSVHLLKEHDRTTLRRLAAGVIEDVLAIEPASARKATVDRVVEIFADLRHEVVAMQAVREA